VELGGGGWMAFTPPMLSDNCNWSWVCTVGTAIATQLAFAHKMPLGAHFTTVDKVEKDYLMKIVELKDKVEIEDATPWHLTATVRLTDKTVYKVRISAYLDYECNCLWFQRHRSPCKHVLATVLKVLEEAKIIKEPKAETYDFYIKAVNKVAYAKSLSKSKSRL
jgi:hypothetical protein